MHGSFLYWKLDLNGEVNIIGYERIVHGQSWVVGSGVEAQGSHEPCGMWF